MLSKDGSCRLRRKLYCPETGKEYDFKETSRGYEIAPDQYVIVTDEELQTLKPEAGRHIEITDFVDLEEIDPVFYNRPYWLAPDEKGAKAYQLLLDAMNGDASLFSRSDEVETAWGIIDPIHAAWQSPAAPPLETYPKGHWGPDSSDHWMRAQNRQWFDVCPVLH